VGSTHFTITYAGGTGNDVVLTAGNPPIIVTTIDDAGAGSLRQAILDANATSGADTITFQIDGSSLWTIHLVTVLPDITDTVSIDAYTQSGASVNTLAAGDNAVLKIELDGSAISGYGLHLVAGSSGSSIRGLIINGFGQAGIAIEDSSYNLIVG